MTDDKYSGVRAAIRHKGRENQLNGGYAFIEARQEWSQSAETRAEFGNDFESFVAFKRAERAGRAKHAPATVIQYPRGGDSV